MKGVGGVRRNYLLKNTKFKNFASERVYPQKQPLRTKGEVFVRADVSIQKRKNSDLILRSTNLVWNPSWYVVARLSAVIEKIKKNHALGVDVLGKVAAATQFVHIVMTFVVAFHHVWDMKQSRSKILRKHVKYRHVVENVQMYYAYYFLSFVGLVGSLLVLLV